MSIDNAAEEAEDRREELCEGSCLGSCLKKPSRAVVEEEESLEPKFTSDGLLLRNSSERLRMSRRDDIEDWDIKA